MRYLLGLIVLGLCGQLGRADDFDDLLKQLSHPQYRVRESASTKIVALGEPALVRLRNVQSSDAEVADRVKRLISTITADLYGERAVIQHPNGDRLFAATISPDGKLVLSGGPDGVIRLWNSETGLEQPAFATLPGPLCDLQFSHDGKRLATVTNAGTIEIFDWATRKSLLTYKNTVGGETYDLTWSGDDRLLAAGSSDRFVYVWESATGKVVQKIEVPSGSWARASTITPDGKRVLGGQWDQTARVWDVATGKEVTLNKDHQYIMSTITTTKDSKTAISSCGDAVIRWWDIETGKSLRHFTGHSGYVFSARLSPNDKQLLSGGADKTLRLWDTETGQLIYTFEGHQEQIFRVEFDRQMRFALSSDLRGTIRLWRLGTKKNKG